MRPANEAPPRAARLLASTVSVAEILAYVQQDCFLSKRSAAEYSDLGVKKIETAIRLGQLRAFTVGKKLVIKKSELDRWIEAGEVTRRSEPQKTDLQALLTSAIATARKRRPTP